MGIYEIGTIIEDQGKIGVIKGIIDPNTMATGHVLIDIRKNYEIYYCDGHTGFLGCKSLSRLVESGQIRVLYDPNNNKDSIEVLDN